MGTYIDSLIAGDRTSIMNAAAVYLGIMGFYSVFFCLALQRWPSTVGTMTTHGLSRFGWSNSRSDQTYHADVAYTYVVDGQMYEGKRLSPTVMIASTNLRALLRWQMKGIERVGDDGVRVFYKPSNPKKSYLIIPSQRTIISVAVLVFGSAALILAAI